MDVITAIRQRRSVRRFRPDSIEPEKTELLKDALIWAPSAGNLQKRRFYFVYNSDIKKKLSAAALGQRFIMQAPLVVVGCADSTIDRYYGERGVHLYCLQDVACSIENMMLMAHSMGLGSVWVGAFDEEEIATILSLPENLRPVAIVPVGLPDEHPAPPRRVKKEVAVTEIK
jgi:nitroreductase